MPTQLRPQGHDIIRTWAFYTILRTKALMDVRPWDTILVNGMALGEDGHKMSKSLNNFIRPEEVFEVNGADSLRQWAALGGTPGNDIMFQWKEITAASRFLQKLWSIYRFSSPLMAKTNAHPGQVDRWLLGELDILVRTATEAMDKYQFDEAFKAIRVFTWEVLADNYIELVKARLYGPDGPEKRAAQNTLYTAMETLVRLMAPFVPFISEEIYQNLTGNSVHVQSWPMASGMKADKDGHKDETAGLQIKEIAASIRRYKSEKGLALNAQLPGITVYSDIELETIDLHGVANSPVETRIGRPEIEMRPVGVKPLMKVLGPMFKDKSGRIIKALTGMDPAKVVELKASGTVKVDLVSETVDVPTESIEVITETFVAGQAVDLLKVGKATVLVKR
jgi:valyl-tRNA synthetase